MSEELEVDDETGGDAGAIGVTAGSVQADVVELGAEGQVRKDAEIHAATDAIGKLVRRTPGRDARAAKEGLHEGVDLGGVVEGQTRPEEIGVGVKRSAAWGSMVAAKVADDAKPIMDIVGNRAADTVLIEAPGATETEVGVAEGGIYGLGARRDSEYRHCNQEEDELFHTVRSFRAFESVRIRATGGKDGLGAGRRTRFILMQFEEGWQGKRVGGVP
jgi:hypothetical protein